MPKRRRTYLGLAKLFGPEMRVPLSLLPFATGLATNIAHTQIPFTTTESIYSLSYSIERSFFHEAFTLHVRATSPTHFPATHGPQALTRGNRHASHQPLTGQKIKEEKQDEHDHPRHTQTHQLTCRPNNSLARSLSLGLPRLPPSLTPSPATSFKAAPVSHTCPRRNL